MQSVTQKIPTILGVVPQAFPTILQAVPQAFHTIMQPVPQAFPTIMQPVPQRLFVVGQLSHMFGRADHGPLGAGPTRPVGAVGPVADVRRRSAVLADVILQLFRVAHERPHERVRALGSSDVIANCRLLLRMLAAGDGRTT